jgi:sterol desaturase/sphingolipid hydroxylase (fatty acid hydroxylase superfamily)
MQVILFFVLFVVFAVAEVFEPKRPGPPRRRTRWVVNLGLTLINIVVLSLLPVSLFTVSIWAFRQNVGLLNWLELPAVAVVMLTLLGRGLISFLTHYLNHRVPAFWRVHRVHHLDTELDVSTTVRFHPFEFVIGLLPGVPLAVTFGFSPWVLLLYELLDAAVTLFSHANIRLPPRLERLLRYMIVTPDLHRVHHSSYQLETDSNFSAVFPIWDMVFGTYRTSTRVPQEQMQIGLKEIRDERTERLSWLLASPLIKFEPAPEQPLDAPADPK